MEKEISDIHYRLGLELAKDGHDEEAIAKFKMALEHDPLNAGAFNNLGLAYAHFGEMDLAIEQYQKALKLKRNFAKAHNNLGVAYVKKEQVDWAIAHFKQALQLAPNYPEAQKNLQTATFRKGHFEMDEGAARRLRNDFAVAQFNSIRSQRRSGILAWMKKFFL
ncbi:MAG TPA: tetratricopeptide repeat protein [Chroococcales cyanobacterium]